ncbi:hypothetical protein ACFSMW_16080 [Virgibacillus halophilus]
MGAVPEQTCSKKALERKNRMYGGFVVSRLSVGASIFTAIFTGITVFLCFSFFPDSHVIIKALIAGLLALLGQLIGGELFPKISRTD